MRFLSLFSGIEAASCAWIPLGWECVAVAEIEKFPCAVLAHHYPNVPNLGDITKITEQQIVALDHIDLVVGGFPCQDLSVAGKRKGLKNEDGSNTRSGLFFDAMRIVRWSKARFLLIENVPGLYSSNNGRDFAAVAGEILGVEFDVPRDGWKNTGVAASEIGLLEWTTLDAQWFGVPQRRRRFFAFADFGDWRSRPPVLFERQSMSGHSAPRRKKGKGTSADLAPSLTASGRGVDRCGDTRRQDPVVAVAFGGGNTSGSIDIATACNASAGGRIDFESETFCITPPLTGNPYGDNASRENLLIAFDCKSSGQNGFGVGDIASTLRSMGHANSHQNGGSHLAVYYGVSESPDTVREEISSLVPIAWSEELTASVDIAGTIQRGGMGGRHDGVMTGMAVRRLTPIECERLQGFKDGYTSIPTWKGWRKMDASETPESCIAEGMEIKQNKKTGKWRVKDVDGPRYKALGNSMAVPCMRWLGERIEMVEDITKELEKTA